MRIKTPKPDGYRQSSMAEKWFPYDNKLDIDEQYFQGVSFNI